MDWIHCPWLKFPMAPIAGKIKSKFLPLYSRLSTVSFTHILPIIFPLITYHVLHAKTTLCHAQTFSAFFHHTCFFYFIYLLWEKERGWVGGAGAKREGERIPSRLHTVSAEPNIGFNPRTMRSWTEPKSRVEAWRDIDSVIKWNHDAIYLYHRAVVSIHGKIHGKYKYLKKC